LVAGALTKPLNVLGPLLKGATVAQLADAGARRISTGGALARAAFTALLRACAEMREAGSFAWTSDLASSADMTKLLSTRVV
jgi:2-methylisocitrate lyase-like PEP mutase family enzyme